jgi:hypothetical protein
LVAQGQWCALVKWSRSVAVELTKPHALPGQWHGVCALARLAVAMLVIVGRPDCAAVDDIWAWEADGLHQLLHGIAPAVATSGHATHMALAIASDLELVTTHRTKQCALLCTAYRHICQHVH